MSAIRLAGVSKTFRRGREEVAHALCGVSVSVEPGELMVFVGPSGCGKTTLLRLIAGLESADEGDIFIGDHRVNQVEPKDRDVAMVFQDYALYPHMTVFQNIAFGLQARGVKPPTIRTRVAEAAKLVGIGELLERRPRELSGGQRQRVALGRAIVRQPKAFLLDEPLSNLDAQLRAQLRVELAELHRRLQTTMLFVTHDQTEAMTLGDRIAVLCDGSIQQIDTPRNLYASPANVFVARFIGSPAMNLLPQNDGTILGLHAEHLRLVALDAEESRFAVTISIVEFLGSHIIVHASLGQHELVARLPSDCIPPEPGSRIGVAYSNALALRFDARTGRRLQKSS